MINYKTLTKRLMPVLLTSTLTFSALQGCKNPEYPPKPFDVQGIEDIIFLAPRLNSKDINTYYPKSFDPSDRITGIYLNKPILSVSQDNYLGTIKQDNSLRNYLDITNGSLDDVNVTLRDSSYVVKNTAAHQDSMGNMGLEERAFYLTNELFNLVYSTIDRQKYTRARTDFDMKKAQDTDTDIFRPIIIDGKPYVALYQIRNNINKENLLAKIKR